MMKAKLLIATLFMGLLGLAQEGPKISSAKIALDRNDLMEAKNYIDEAQEVIESKSPGDIRRSRMQRYYLYRGTIYTELYNTQEPANPEYLHEAKSAYLGLISYEKSEGINDETRNAVQNLNALIGAIQQEGDRYLFELEDHQKAYNTYKEVYELRKHPAIAQVDTATLYNMAQLANRMGLDTTREAYLDTARMHYKELIDYGYTGITWTAELTADNSRAAFPTREMLDQYIGRGLAVNPEKSKNILPNIWSQYLALTRNMGLTEEFEEMLAVARKAYPENDDLLKLELQAYFDRQDYEGALSNLEEVVRRDTANVLYLYNIGFIYHRNKKDLDNGLEYYKRALKVDSTYNDALYMAGLVHVERANAISEEMNSLPRDAQRKYNQLDVEKDVELENALSYFLRAYEVLPDDRATVEAIREVYFKLGNAAKVGEFTRVLNALPEEVE